MNSDRFPEETNDERASQVEQSLRQLQPRSVSFDAEAILAAAETSSVELANRAAHPQRLSVRWLTISAAFACGVVAGGALTAAVLMRAIGDEPSVADSPQRTDKANSPNQSIVKDSDKSKGNARQDNPTPQVARLDQWSPSERLVAVQLLEMRQPRPIDDPPLRAGNYARRSEALSLQSDERPVEVRVPNNVQPSLKSDEPNADAPPTRSMDRKQLLRELLGGAI